MLTELTDRDRARLISAGFRAVWDTFEFLRPCYFRVDGTHMAIVLPPYCVRDEMFICERPIADAISNHWANLLDCCYLWLGVLCLDVCFADGSVAWGQAIAQVRVGSI
jgi:hypothetical protein